MPASKSPSVRPVQTRAIQIDGAADDETESASLATSLATRSSSSIVEVMGGRNNLQPIANGHLIPREGLESTSTIALDVDSERINSTSTLDADTVEGDSIEREEDSTK